MLKKQILIIDKVGIIGNAICSKIVGCSLVIFVSKRTPDAAKETASIIYVAYEKKIPTIPNGEYSNILIVDDKTKVTGEVLEPLLKKAKRDNSVFILATYFKRIDAQLIKNIVSFYKRAFIVVFGDVFDETAIGDAEEFKSIANDFIYQAAVKGRIEVAGDGLLKTFPVFIDDLVSKIVDKVFDSKSACQIFKIFPKHYRTEISLAHLIQKPNPFIVVDFVETLRHNQLENEDILREGEYLLEESYPLASKIRKVDLGQKINLPNKEFKFSENKKRKRLRLFFLRFLLFLFVFLTLPFITTLFFFLLGANSLNGVRTALDKGNLEFSKKEALNAKVFFGFSKKASEALLAETKFIGLDKKLNGFLEKISFGEKISLSIADSQEAIARIQNVLNGKSKNPKEDFNQAKNILKNSIIVFNQTKTGGKIPKALGNQINSFETLIRVASSTIDFWPDIFGFNGKKTYLVLFQNNMELRSGGGFIGSYAILSIDNGRILDFPIYDAYDSDGQLKGHVEPPYPLRRYLPIPHYYLRDSNFDLDFAKGAGETAFLYNLETGKTVDGVIGVDLSFVKNLISALGSVYVDDYKETINKDNLFLLAQSKVEKNFFPGSTQKKDFLRSLFRSILLSFENKKEVSYILLAKSINDSLDQKHLLFAFDNQALQNVFTINNWSSTLWDGRKNSETLINDFLGINETNLGVNKVNFFIKRKISQNVSIKQDGSLEDRVSISYFNLSEKDKLFGGDYKNYLRIIAPKNTLLNISIDGEDQMIVPAITDFLTYEKNNFLPPKGLEVETREKEGKTVYGFLVMVPPGKLKTVTAKYVLSQKALLENKAFNYSLRVFKQPGTDEYPFEFSLTYPSQFKIVSSSREISKKDDFAVFSKSLLSDKELFVSLAEK